MDEFSSLSTRLKNRLIENGFTSKKSVLEKYYEDKGVFFLKQPGLGKKTFNELKEWLNPVPTDSWEKRLPTGTLNALKRAGIDNEEKIYETFSKYGDIPKIDGIGDVGLKLICRLFGIKLKPEPNSSRILNAISLLERNGYQVNKK